MNLINPLFTHKYKNDNMTFEVFSHDRRLKGQGKWVFFAVRRAARKNGFDASILWGHT